MIEPRYGVLQTLFADRVFRVPSYQRFYSWHQRQREDLFGDLRKLAEEAADQHHFMATLVCHRTPETREVGATQYRIYDIVDGQQRLTTLIILLKCIERALPEESEDRLDIARTLVKRDGHLVLLQTNNANQAMFNQFIREGAAPNENDIRTYSDRNLAAAIRDCTRFVRSWTDSRDTLSLMRLVLHRLGFVVFDTEDSRSVFTVFEVLNSRGLAVDWLDKTKSVLMGKVHDLAASSNAATAEMNSLQDIWSEIYREIAKEEVPGEEVLRVTATLFYGTGQGKPRSAEESLDLLRAQCTEFTRPGQISLRLVSVAQKLVELYGSTNLGPVTEILHARLLAVAIKLATGVNEEERQLLLRQWEHVTFRIFGLFAKDSRTKVGDYVRLSTMIATNHIDMRTYNQIMRALRELGKEHPIEGAVEAIVEKNSYENADVCRYLLWCYEEHLADRAGANATIGEREKAAIWKQRASDSIEHIYPQNEQAADWVGKMRRREVDAVDQSVAAHVHRIGNLMLLPLPLNQAARDSSFRIKKTIYEQHRALRMVQEVQASDDWTLEEIVQREQRIIAWARQRWADI